jgi:glycerate kinase
MYRVEIISNKSVEEDITQTLEEYIPQILYTKIPLAYGRGGDDRKLGNSTWPETNFVLVSYVEDEQFPKVRAVIDAVKKRFPDEGIKIFAVKSEI